MKRINPDLQATLTNKFVKELSFLRKFKRYWQTEVVDGVEVFKARNYYYPANRFEESTKKLAKLLGMYDKLQGKQEGVRNAWLYLNPRKAPDVDIKPSYDIYARNFNKALEGISNGTVTISSKVLGKNEYELAPIISAESNQEALIAEIQSKYNTLWSTDYTVYGGSVDDYQALFFMYLLRSNDIEYEITKVEKITAPITYPTGWDETTLRVSTQPAWRVSFTFTPVEILETTDIVLLLSEDAIKQETTAAMQVGSHLSSSKGSVEEEGEGYAVYEPTEISASDFWHIRINTGGLGIPTVEQYLKTNILTTTSLSRKERIRYILSCIDTGYRKKSAKWYEVVIAIVVIVVVTIYSAGTGTAAAAAAWGGVAGLVAATVTLAAFILSVIAYALGAAGLTRMAGVMGEFLKTVEPLVRVAGIVTIIGSYISMARTALQAAQEGVRTSITQTVVDVVVETTKDIIERITGFTSLANMQVSHVLKMTEFLFGIYESDRTKEMNRMLKNERAELAQHQQMDEQAKTSDLLKDFALTYPDLLSQDNSVYANLYDRPYEWWSTPYHTGCIQATTVNALWLSKD